MTGPGLIQIAKADPWLIKINREEFNEWYGLAAVSLTDVFASYNTGRLLFMGLNGAYETTGLTFATSTGILTTSGLNVATSATTTIQGGLTTTYASSSVVRVDTFFQNSFAANCDSASSKVIYNATNGTFSCAIDAGSGAGSNVWATSTNEMIIYPSDNNDVVVIGSGATTTDAKLEVLGKIAGTIFVASSTSATSTLPLLSTSRLLLGSDYVTDLTGTGLALTDSILSIVTTGDWTGIFDGQEGAWYLANSFSTTSADYWEAQQSRPYTADSLTDNFLAISAMSPHRPRSSSVRLVLERHQLGRPRNLLIERRGIRPRGLNRCPHGRPHEPLLHRPSRRILGSRIH
jgi:hypothetical protein